MYVSVYYEDWIYKKNCSLGGFLEWNMSLFTCNSNAKKAIHIGYKNKTKSYQKKILQSKTRSLNAAPPMFSS